MVKFILCMFYYNKKWKKGNKVYYIHITESMCAIKSDCG